MNQTKHNNAVRRRERRVCYKQGYSSSFQRRRATEARAPPRQYGDSG